MRIRGMPELNGCVPGIYRDKNILEHWNICNLMNISLFCLHKKTSWWQFHRWWSSGKHVYYNISWSELFLRPWMVRTIAAIECPLAIFERKCFLPINVWFFHLENNCFCLNFVSVWTFLIVSCIYPLLVERTICRDFLRFFLLAFFGVVCVRIFVCLIYIVYIHFVIYTSFWVSFIRPLKVLIDCQNMPYLVYDSAYNSVTQRFKFTISKISIFYSLEHMQLYKNIEDTMSWNFEL